MACPQTFRTGRFPSSLNHPRGAACQVDDTLPVAQFVGPCALVGGGLGAGVASTSAQRRRNHLARENVVSTLTDTRKLNPSDLQVIPTFA